MSKVAIVETKPSNNRYEALFDESFDFELFQLNSDPTVKKVLKKDVTLSLDIDNYDWIVLIGSEPLKYFTNITSITEYSGKVVDDKFLPIINPAMLVFKPEARPMWADSKQEIIAYITGSKEKIDWKEDAFIGITEESEALAYLQAAYDWDDEIVSIDSETTSLYPKDGYVLGISISYKEDMGAYIASECITDEVTQAFQKLFNKKIVIMHNAKFDLGFLEYHFGFEFPKVEDTMLMKYILDETPGTNGLKSLALKYTKYGDYEKPMLDWNDKYCRANGILKANFTYDLIPFDLIKVYAALDAAVTFLLYKKFKPLLDKNSKLSGVYSNILIPGTRFLLKMQNNGVPFNLERLLFSQEFVTKEIQDAVAELYTFPEVKAFEEWQAKPLNPASVLQLRKLFFDSLGLNPTGIKTAKGEHSTNAEVLEILAKQHAVPEHILKIRQKTKIKNTYLDKIIPQLNRDGRLRTFFNLHTTTSGRLSSSGKLNMQQIIRDDPTVKGCIMAPPGRLIHSLDLKTAEVYVAAVLSNDTVLQNIFVSGQDFHSAIAHKVFRLSCVVDLVKDLFPTQRQYAKAISFGIMYGAGARKISEQVTKDGGSLSASEADEIIKEYFATFYRLEKWFEEEKEKIKGQGYIYSAFGRKRRLPEAREGNKGLASHAIRSGLNFLVQSVASDINLLGAIEAQDRIEAEKMDTKIFALVHDSILADVPIDEVEKYTEIVVSCVQRDRGFSIMGTPIGVDVDTHQDYSFGKFEKKYAGLY